MIEEGFKHVLLNDDDYQVWVAQLLKSGLGMFDSRGKGRKKTVEDQAKAKAYSRIFHACQL